MREGGKNTQFSANKSTYLRNGARYNQGYNDGLIEVAYALSIGIKVDDLG